MLPLFGSVRSVAEQLNHWHEHDQAEEEPALGDDDVDQPQTAGMDSE